MFRVAAAMAFLSLLCACETQDTPDTPEPGGTDVPEGMVEIRPVLPGMYGALPRVVPAGQSVASRTYPSNEQTDKDLSTNKLLRLPKGATVWLIAENATAGQEVTYETKSYVVYNPDDDENMSYLVPCTVDTDGKMLSVEGVPLYLKDGNSYKFYAISPARKLDEAMFKSGTVGFRVKNGEQFYANDCRYASTEPEKIDVHSDNSESVQVIKLKPMVNQTAELKFQIKKGIGVHQLGIQPSGIEISGLQNDEPTDANPVGLIWHMSKSRADEPITLQHGDKYGIYNDYDYTIDSEGRVNIEVPVLPMYSISKPVIVVFRLKVNGVPTSYEMMLNEKDFKAGYSYGYRGEVSISEGVSVITWQYVSWEHDVPFPFDEY